MKKRLILCLIPAMLCLTCRAADSVEPASCTVTNVRGEAAASVSAGTIYRGTSLNLTNCVACTTNDSTIQGLDGVTVQVSVGNLTTNIDYTATVQSTNAGTWHCTVTVPDLSSWTLQVKVTDASTNSYIYPSKVLTAESSMF